MITKKVYEELTTFRDKNNLASYTEAVKELLKFYRDTTTNWSENFTLENIPSVPVAPLYYLQDETGK